MGRVCEQWKWERESDLGHSGKRLCSLSKLFKVLRLGTPEVFKQLYSTKDPFSPCSVDHPVAISVQFMAWAHMNFGGMGLDLTRRFP